MFPKERDRSKTSASRPPAPKLAAHNAFVRSPPTAPRLAAAFSSSPSSGAMRASPFAAPNASSSPTLVTPIGAALPRKSAAKINGNGASDAVDSSNITPRTAARKSKLNSASSTPRASTSKPDIQPRSPNTTTRNPPSATNPLSSPSSLKIKSSPATPTGRNGIKPARSGQRGLPIARSQVSPTPLRQSGDLSNDGDLGESFFHARDAPSNSPPRRPAPPKSASSFVYANGQRNVSQEEPPSEVASVQGDQSQTAPANEPTQAFVPFSTTSPPFKLNNSPPSIFHRPMSASSAPVAMQVYNSISPRPMSSPKQDLHLSYRKGASQIIRPAESRSPLPETSLAELGLRQVSLDTVSESFDAEPSASHIRTSSISSQSLPGIPVTSPIGQDTIDTTNSQTSLAAKARQERKVLDLEISNSSLLAINRSLEREVRRQKIEIRRYRRLSRNSNRTSWPSDATTPDPLDDDIIEEESDEDSPSDFGVDDMTDPDSIADDTLSPFALAQSDERHLRHDQKRLQLDLSKHKQLLVDSQKMNGSIKRCLGLSEQLIKDAGKALAYKVNVTDVRLGGRVLSPEEVDRDAESGDDSNSYFYNKWRTENDRLSVASQRLIADWDGGTDNDSGVDLQYGRQSQDAADRDRPPSLTQSDVAVYETF